MKKTSFSVALIALFTLHLNAGKGVAPVTVEPIPIPLPIKVPLGLYIGGGLTYATAECECEPLPGTNGTIIRKTSSDTYGVNLKAGYNFNEFIGVEVKYFYTPWGDKDRTLKHYGIYLKPTYPVTDHLDLYALLGYGKTECDILPESESGFGWGVGASYTLNKKIKGKKDGVGFYVEYLRPLKKTGNKKITIDTVHTGIEYNW